MTFHVLCRKLKNFTFQEACRKLRYRIWSSGSILLLVRPANAPADPFSCKPRAGELRRVTEADLPDCAAFEDPARYVPIYKNMLKKGDIVHFGYLDGKCVFRHCLMLSGSFTYREHTVRELTPNEAYVHYGYCAPEARGKRFHQASLFRFPHDFPGRVLYAEVREDNIPSLQGCFRAGYRPYSRLTVKKRFFRSVLTETPLSGGEIETLLALVQPRKDFVNMDKNITPPPPAILVDFDVTRRSAARLPSSPLWTRTGRAA